MEQPITPLHYAAGRQPFFTRRRLSILLTVLGIALLIRPLWALGLYLDSLYWQHQAGNYIPPSNQIALQWPTASPTPITAPLPPAWTHLNAPKVSAAMNQGLILLHALHVPHGEPVLVAVNALSPRATAKDTVGPVILEICTKTSGWQVQWTTLDWPVNERPFALYVAQLDPNDPAHFTFTAQVGKTTHVMDGYLRADGSLLIGERSAAPQ